MKDYNKITSRKKIYKQQFKEFYCYWGTWCRMVLETEPHYPKYKEYIEYKITCIKANIGYETLEQARKNPNKVQTGVTYEYFDYDTLYYCNIYKIADEYDILEDYKFYRKEDAEDCIKKELKKKYPDEKFRIVEIQRKYTR